MSGYFCTLIHGLCFLRRGLCCRFGQARRMGRHAPSTTSPSQRGRGGAGRGVARVHPFLPLRRCRSGTRAMPLLR
uniref:Secreted protein n=1 Tax=Ixodes ricinus TaxID=34613 RepID=A0A6B0U3L4_IXORI